MILICPHFSEGILLMLMLMFPGRVLLTLIALHHLNRQRHRRQSQAHRQLLNGGNI